MYTLNGAKLLGNNRIGALKKNFLADIIVCNKNVLKIKKNDIHNVKILLTIVNGKIIYKNT
jgi:predicted amidohydrolase YtcJ